MARVKRPANQDDSTPHRRSQRRRAAVQPPRNSGEPETVDLEADTAAAPVVDTPIEKSTAAAPVVDTPLEDPSTEKPKTAVAPVDFAVKPSIEKPPVVGTLKPKIAETLDISVDASVKPSTESLQPEGTPVINQHSEKTSSHKDARKSCNVEASTEPSQPHQAAEAKRPVEGVPDLNINAENEVFSNLKVLVEDWYTSEDDDVVLSYTQRTVSPEILYLTWPFDKIQTSPTYQPNTVLDEHRLDEMDPLWRRDDQLRGKDVSGEKEAEVDKFAQHHEHETVAQSVKSSVGRPIKKSASNLKKKRNLGNVFASKTNTAGTSPPLPKEKITRTRKKSIATKPPRKKTGSFKKTDASTSQPTNIPRPDVPNEGFSCEEALAMFEKTKKKTAIIDKGFEPRSILEFDFIHKVVEKQGWEIFCQVKQSYNLTLLREFYAEASVGNPSILTVRGTDISFSSEAINNMLGLTSHTNTEFETLLHAASKAKLDEIVAFLGKPGTSWEPHPNFKLRTFRAANLVPDANVWMNFIRSSLNPTTHDSSLSCERMILLYCIMSGKTINVGDIVFKAIKYSAKRTQGKLFFPGLLSSFLSAGGVPQYEDDLIQTEGEEKWAIDMKAVARLLQRKASPGDMVGMMQDLIAQNSSLMESLLGQRNEFVGKMKKMKAVLVGKLKAARKENKNHFKEIKEELQSKAGERVKKLIKKMKKLKAENRRLAEENGELIEERDSLKKEVNAAALAATTAATAKDAQPTPKE